MYSDATACHLPFRLTQVSVKRLSSLVLEIVLPSGETRHLTYEITFPLSLSVSSIVFASIFFSDTVVTPGSPL